MPKIKLTKEEESLLVQKNDYHYFPVLFKKIKEGEYEINTVDDFENLVLDGFTRKSTKVIDGMGVDKDGNHVDITKIEK